MKNVHVAWRLIDVVREGQKLNKMTSMLLLHPGFESVCPNSCVLVTATIGLKTKQKKAVVLLKVLLKATPQTPETEGNPKNWNLRGATAESEVSPS